MQVGKGTLAVTAAAINDTVSGQEEYKEENPEEELKRKLQWLLRPLTSIGFFHSSLKLSQAFKKLTKKLREKKKEEDYIA